MLIIRVGNVRSQVMGTVKEIAEVKKYLRFPSPGYHFSDSYQKRKDLEAELQQLYTKYNSTLSIEYQEVLKEYEKIWDGWINLLNYKNEILTGFIPMIANRFKCVYQDQRDLTYFHGGQFIDRSFNGITLREDQYKLLQDITTGAKFKALPFHRGIIDAATNYGKSYVIAGLINYFAVKTLILIYDKDVFDQLIEFLTDIFPNVGYVGKGKINISDITVCMPKTLANRMKKSVNVKKTVQAFSQLIVDESHRAGGNDYGKLVKSLKMPIRYFFSGTSLDREKKSENLNLIGMSGPVLAKIKNKELIASGVSSKVRVIVVKNDPRIDCYSYTDEKRYVIERSAPKMYFISDYCGQPNKYILISVRTIEHGKYYLDYLQTDYPDKTIVFLHGKTPFRKSVVDDLRNGLIDIVITTVLRVGVNIPVFTSLIVAQGGKSTIEIKQLVGRLLRKDEHGNEVEVVDFRDCGLTVQTHAQLRINIYRKEGFEINEIEDFTEYEKLTK